MNWGRFFQAYDTYLKCKDQSNQIHNFFNREKKFFLIDIEVSEECKQILLDLLCINNSGDMKEKLVVEEQWFTMGQIRDTESRPKFVPQNTWK